MRLAQAGGKGGKTEEVQIVGHLLDEHLVAGVGRDASLPAGRQQRRRAARHEDVEHRGMR
jgi:hypothetical protein